MDTTTVSSFWEGVASSTGTMISNTNFWTLLGQTILVIMVLGALFSAFWIAFKLLAGRKRANGRKRW